MAKLILITAALLEAAAFEELAKSIAENPKDAAADVVVLAQENSAQLEEIESLKKERDSLAKINKELQDQLNKLPTAEAADQAPQKPTLSAETFTVSNKKYGFVYPAVRLDGVLVTNADVLADKKLQAKLVEMKSGSIKEL